METVDTSLPHEVHSDGKNGLHQSYVPVYGPQDWLLRLKQPGVIRAHRQIQDVLRLSYESTIIRGHTLISV